MGFLQVQQTLEAQAASFVGPPPPTFMAPGQEPTETWLSMSQPIVSSRILFKEAMGVTGGDFSLAFLQSVFSRF